MKGPIARGTIRTTFVLGLRLVIQAGTLLLVARMLGPHRFGAFAGVAALAVLLGTLSTFGTHLVLLREVSKDPTRRNEVLSYAIPTTFLWGCVLLGIYVLVCTLALRGKAIATPALLTIGIAEILLQPSLTLRAAEHHGLGRIARSQILQILPLALRLIAAGALLLSNAPSPLTAYSYGYLVAALIALGIATKTVPRPWPSVWKYRIPSRQQLRNAAGYAALNITAASPGELDKTLATKLLDLSAAGVYAAGARVINATTLPISAMTLAALPRLFREAQRQSWRTTRLLRWLFFTAFAYGVALAVLLWIAAPAFVWVFGPQYDAIQHTIRWLTLAVPGMALRKVAGTVLVAAVRPWLRVAFEIIGVVLLVICALLFAIPYGISGMAIALVCSEWAMAICGAGLVIHDQLNRRGPALGSCHETGR
jgi:O-antigen/teichoic acid export membrane protein